MYGYITSDKNRASFIDKFFINDYLGDIFGALAHCFSILQLLTYTAFLAIIYISSLFWDCKFINWFLSILTGYSWLTIIYLSIIIIRLDNAIASEKRRGWKDHEEEEVLSKFDKSTRIYGLIMLAVAIALIVFSEKYQKQYSFKCDTFYIESSDNTYHLHSDCGLIHDEDDLQEIKGVNIIRSRYVLCEGCKEWAYDLDIHKEIRYSIK